MAGDLVGSAEIAAMLGVSRQRVDQLASASGFPEPIADLSAGRIWTRRSIEAWMAGQESRAPAADLDREIAASLSDDMRRLMVAAQESARRLRHAWVGTEHLLLAVLSADGLTDAVAAAAQVGIRRGAVEEAVERLVPPGPDEITGPIAFTPRSYSVMGLAKGLAAAESHPSIEPRHLLAALAREGGGVAASVMAEVSDLTVEVLVERLEAALKTEHRRSPVETAEAGEWKCNFCGKPQRKVKKLIAGPGVFICDGCVNLCDDILRDEGFGPKSALAEAAERLDSLAAELDLLRKRLAGLT